MADMSNYCRVCGDPVINWRYRYCSEQCQKEGRNRDERARRKSNPEPRRTAVRASAFRRNYGISLAEYEAMAADQKHLCAICGEKCKSGHRLSVDHDHETGAVRALLCRRCNSGIADFLHRPYLVRLAADYLERHAAIIQVTGGKSLG